MFKNMIVYRIAAEWQGNLAQVEEALTATPFAGCGTTKEGFSGLVPPREEHGAFVESVGGQWIMRFMTEAKLVPSSVIARRVKEAIRPTK